MLANMNITSMKSCEQENICVCMCVDGYHIDIDTDMGVMGHPDIGCSRRHYQKEMLEVQDPTVQIQGFVFSFSGPKIF